MPQKLITYDAAIDEPPIPDDATVIDTAELDDEVTVIVDVPFQVATQELEESDWVDRVDDPFEVHLRTALDYTSRSETATIEDVRRVHSVVKDGATGAEQTVVVMDSGINESHPVFDGMHIQHVDCTGSNDDAADEVGHGTAAAGQIAQLAPDVDLVDLRIFGGSDSTGSQPVLKAYEWLFAHADQVDVVNLSWGTSSISSYLNRLQNKLVSKGVRGVVAAGNSGESGGSPATAEKAFSVGACTEDRNLAPFSSYDPRRENPDLTAIGVDCMLAQAEDTSMGTDLPGPWIKASGTSFSAPDVAGCVAKYLSRDPDASPADVAEAFRESADNLRSTNREGTGLLDYRETVVANETILPPFEPFDHQSEATFEDAVEQYLIDLYGPDAVSRQYRFDDGRVVDLLVRTGFAGVLCLELENDSGSVVTGSGQANYYAQRSHIELGQTGVPMLVVPEGHIEAEERETIESLGVHVRTPAFEGDVSGV